MNTFYKQIRYVTNSGELARPLQVGRPAFQDKSIRIIKSGIWLYFFLLIFEGALRKWILPNLATPLLVIRDPIALFLLFTSIKKGLFPANIYTNLLIVIGTISIITALLIGHGSLAVALFGARILLVQFPLMFVIGLTLERIDILNIGKVVIWITLPMTLLITLQFYSPQSAWVNRGVGGDLAGAGFNGGALGFFRPPGTFSFTNGVSQFYSSASAFIIYFWLSYEKLSKLLLILATGCLLLSIPLSISRTLLFQVVITSTFALAASLRKPQFFKGVLLAATGILIAIIALSSTEFFQRSIDVFLVRFENASELEGGIEGTLVDRFLGGMISALTKSSEIPFLGYGIGMGTNVGSMLLTGGIGFLIAEEEWARLIGELGPLMGISVIIIRLSFTAKITSASYKKLGKGDLLPWMLLSFGLLYIPQAQWAQPTALGFSTLIGGLLIASIRN